MTPQAQFIFINGIIYLLMESEIIADDICRGQRAYFGLIGVYTFNFCVCPLLLLPHTHVRIK